MYPHRFFALILLTLGSLFGGFVEARSASQEDDHVTQLWSTVWLSASPDTLKSESGSIRTDVKTHALLSAIKGFEKQVKLLQQGYVEHFGKAAWDEIESNGITVREGVIVKFFTSQAGGVVKNEEGRYILASINSEVSLKETEKGVVFEVKEPQQVDMAQTVRFYERSGRLMATLATKLTSEKSPSKESADEALAATILSLFKNPE